MNKLTSLLEPRLSHKDRALFIKRLSFLIKGGVPLLESLSIIRRGTKSASGIKILNSVIANVSNGQSLAAGLGKFKSIFGDFTINLIHIGESSGILHQNLNYLAEELKKRQILRKKIASALAYPIIISLATLGITGMLTLYIFPKILPIFESLQIALPVSTKILIAVNNILQEFGYYILLGALTLTTSFWLLRKKVEPFRLFMDKTLISIPLIRKMAVSYNIANFCRTLGLLLKSEVPIMQAIKMTADTTINLSYKRELELIAEQLAKGEKLSENLAKNPRLFPHVVAEMIAIGETTGDLSNTLIYLSELHENEVDDFTKNLSSSLEPLLMLVMGITVGFVAISVITPIYEITQNLHR